MLGKRLVKSFSRRKPIPPCFVSQSLLKSRGLILISGRDAFNVLQGISTNDLALLKNDGIRQAMHACFLNTAGRIISDAIIIKPLILRNEKSFVKQDEFWLDMAKSQIPAFLKHLKLHSLRKKIDFDDISDQMKILSLNSPTNVLLIPEGLRVDLSKWKEEEDEENDPPALPSSSSQEDDLYNQVSFVDPRCNKLGLRVVMSLEDEVVMDGDEKKMVEVEEKQFEKMRKAWGVFEGEEVFDQIPFQANFDLLKSISFKKGCYLGQELMSRTYHKGVVKKRMLPFCVKEGEIEDRNEIFDTIVMRSLMNSSLTIPPASLISSSQSSEQIGKVLTSFNNFGVGLFNYMNCFEINNEGITLNTPSMVIEEKNISLKILWNTWFVESVKNEIKRLKDKNLI